MFHTYVITSLAQPVDFDRARLLMDRDLLRGSIKAMNAERLRNPRVDADYGPQWIWDHYCARHWEKYGVTFRPDDDPGWDR
jgi:hypothetical protein